MSSKLPYLPILCGDMPHHLDHLAPFAWKYSVPLWIENPSIAQLAAAYYPDVTCINRPFDLKDACDQAEALVLTTKSAPAELKAIAHSLGNETTRFAYLPHGQSDKGLEDPALRSIEHADIALLYGPLQHKRLQQFGSDGTIGEVRFVGNFRLDYYQAHQAHLDQLTRDEIFASLPPGHKTYLYAPTWSTQENFTHHANMLIEHLPTNANLVIKLHPLIAKSHPAHMVYLQSLDKSKANVRIIDHFPLIYPLLAYTDVYIGDESAIGYDFLHFDKPMYFLTRTLSPLIECGQIIQHAKDAFQLSALPPAQKGKVLLSQAFARTS